MTTRIDGRARVRWISVLVALVLLVGTGTASAYWAATARVDTDVSAADVGLEQKLLLTGEAPDSPLSGTYTADNSTLAGVVSITNTGTRAAGYTLTVRGAPSGNSNLTAAIQVAAAPVTSTEKCTPGATLAEPTSGALPLTVEGKEKIEADATVVVCVLTSLAASDLSRFADQRVELEISTALEFAAAEQWRIGADRAMTVVQSVEADPFAGVEQMFCAVEGPWEPQLGFTGESEGPAKDAVRYRAFIAHANQPDAKLPLRHSQTTGWHTRAHISNTDADVSALVNSEHGGYGNAWVYVEKTLPGDAGWTPEARGKVRITPSTPEDKNAKGVYCGWLE